MRRFLFLAWLLLNVSSLAFTELPINIIYLNPSDVQSPSKDEIDSLHEVMVEVQTFYASEMEKYGFGAKTFDFNPDIRVVAGKLMAEQYSDIETIKNEIHELNFEVQNKIDIVFLAGRKRILGGALGAILPICWTWPGKSKDVNDCNYLIVIPTGYKEFLLPTTAHEIGHAFGLQHTSEKITSDRVDIMYVSPIFYEGVKVELKDFALSREDATFLNEGGRLSIQQDSRNLNQEIDADVNDDGYVDINDIVSNSDIPSKILTFTRKNDNNLMPINTQNEWDGWVMGVWEKYIDNTITRKPWRYYDFEGMYDFSHWMYCHAPSEIIYDISHEEYTFFRSYFLVPDHPDPTCQPSMKVVVLADDVEIFTMQLHPENSGILIEFDIPSGTKNFAINIDELGNNGCDHYILGEPRLYYDNAKSIQSDTVSLLPASVQSPNIGQQLKLSLKIANGENVAGYQATVQFDETALRFVSGTNGDFLPAGAFFVEPKVEGNLVKLNAASLAAEIYGDGTLATLTFEVIAAKASTLTLSDVLLSNSAGETFIPQIESTQITEPTRLKGDVNGDGTVNIADLVLVASNLGETGQNAADVNGDGQVNIADLVLVAGALGNSASAPPLHPHTLEMLTTTEVKKWLSAAQQLDLTDTTSQRGLLFLHQLLVALTPKETALLPNYPNPFNPETWIPYQLAKDAEVSLTIYAIDGYIVRRLALGHQTPGLYENRSRAAYWDGRNQFGEPVASGLYFYTLTAGDFTATRRMLILK